MSVVAAAVVGSAVVGAYGANRAAASGRAAAGAQAAAADAGIAEQRRQFDQVQQLLAPYVNAGTGNQAYSQFDSRAYLAANPDVAADPFWGQNPELHYQQHGRAEGRQAPMIQVAAQRGSLAGQQDLIGLNGADAQRAAIGAIEGSPQMQALVQQGENAILQNASATGGLRGGNTQGALAQFRPALLSQLIDQQYGRLAGITQLSQNSATGVGTAAMQTGTNVSNLLQQQGAATAGGVLAQGRAQAGYANAISGALGAYAGYGGKF